MTGTIVASGRHFDGSFVRSSRCNVKDRGLCLLRLLGGQVGLYIPSAFACSPNVTIRQPAQASHHRHAEFDHPFLGQQHGQISASSRHRSLGVRNSSAKRSTQLGPLHMLPISRVVICVHITVGADRHCMDGGGIRGYLPVASSMTV